MITISRNVYPVGQGGFSSEIHRNEKGEITFVMVYDCGTASSSAINVKSLVSDFLTDFNGKKIDIDILFISHFDSDHVSMLEELITDREVKNVFIPLLTEQSKAIILTCEGSRVGTLVNNPEEFFAGSNIIKIERFTGELNNYTDAYIINMEEFMQGRISTQDKTLPSGLKFCYKDYWIYSPYNIFQELSEEFLKLCKNDGLEIDANNYTAEYINENKTKLRNIYKKIKGGINKNSLLAFSAPTKAGRFYIENKSLNDYYIRCHEKCCIKHRRYQSYHFMTGCLFTGDCDLNKVENPFFLAIKCFEDKVGTMQIPHHGSKLSWQSNIIRKKNFFEQIHSYFVQYGKNRYGHPSSIVLDEITHQSFKRSRYYLCTPNIYHVTDEPSTLFTQLITEL